MKSAIIVLALVVSGCATAPPTATPQSLPCQEAPVDPFCRGCGVTLGPVTSDPIYTVVDDAGRVCLLHELSCFTITTIPPRTSCVCADNVLEIP